MILTDQVRMGKGKGAFDHWAVRIPVGRIVFEIKAPELKEELAKHALELAGSRLPGRLVFVRRSDQTPYLGLGPVKAAKTTIPNPSVSKPITP